MDDFFIPFIILARWFLNFDMHNNYYSGLLIKIMYTVFYAWCKETSRVIWFLWLLALYTDYVI